MPSPAWPLQQAIFAKLTAALDPVAVYDGVPPNAQRPYVVIGDDACVDDSTKDQDSWLITASLEAWDDRARGRKSVKQILGAIHDALHRQALAVTGFTVDWVRYVSESTEQSDDGLTYLGIIRFQIRVEGEEF